MSSDSLIFLKLGGSLITDKNREGTARPERIRQVALEVRAALNQEPGLRLLIGHGSGSFGHFAGRRHGTREGVRGPDAWRGFTQVSAAAARLNRLVTDILLESGLPVISLQPSASASCHDGAIEDIAWHPIRTALDHHLIPLVYGDVAFDSNRGGTIISTEEIFAALTPLLRPDHILLVGQVAGVLGPDRKPIERLSHDHIREVSVLLGGSHGVDVTGGMSSKVTAMLRLVGSYPNLDARIISGLVKGNITTALLNPASAPGTLLAGI